MLKETNLHAVTKQHYNLVLNTHVPFGPVFSHQATLPEPPQTIFKNAVLQISVILL